MRPASTAWAASVLLLSLCAGAADDALLLVKSEPSGAGVFVDGDAEPRGTTPCVVLVAPGPHRVRLELGDLQASAEAVAVAGAPVTVELKLTAPDSLPQRTQRTQSGAASETSVSSVAKALAEFDSLVNKGDYAGARRRMEGAASGAGAADADVVRAAIRAADALAARRKAITAAATALTWKDTELRTTKGVLAGEVQSVADDGLVLIIRKKLRGGGAVETRAKIRWSDLTPEQGDELAREGGWRPAGADLAVVRAYLALARKDARAAEKALAAAGGHPLAEHLRRRIEAPRSEAAERAARSAWEGIRRAATAARAAGAARTSAVEARRLVARIAAFQKRFRDTEFASSISEEAEAMRIHARRSLLPTRGLVAHWPLDESGGTTARDVSGNGHHGTLHGGALTNMDPASDRVAGKVGTGALDLDGVNDFVEVTGYKGITGSNPRTVAAWIKTSSAEESPIVSWGTNVKRRKYVLQIETGARAIRVEISNGRLAGSTIVNDGRWHHVALVLPAGSTNVKHHELYVDGALEAVSSSRGEAIDTASGTDLRIGKDFQNAHFSGAIDDVRIYDRALTAAEVAVLYRADAPAGKTAEPGPPETAPEPPPGDVKRRTTGLLGTYFSGRNHDRAVIRRLDPQVDFKWGTAPPDPRVPRDFSVRWEGFILAPETGRYVFHVDSDDGFRMWLSGKQIFDKWGAMRVVKGQSSSVSLAKGGFYPVRIEHMDARGNASVHLRWTGPGTTEPVPVPTECLRPPQNYERLPGPPFAR